MAKIAVVGVGYIGKYILEYLKDKHQIITIGRTDCDYFLDLLQPVDFDYSVLNDVDYILFTAAISSPDKCADEYDICWKINVEGSNYFINKVLESKSKVIFFSSDSVYGKDREIFDEQSKTNANKPYGKMKKAIEDIYRENDKFKSIRLAYVFSKNDKFSKYCISCIENEQVAEIFHPFYRNVCSIKSVISVVDQLMSKWDEYKSIKTVNVAGTELVSRIRIADELNRIYGGKLKYKIIEPEESFWENREQVTQVRSLYAKLFGMDESFTDIVKSEFGRK